MNIIWTIESSGESYEEFIDCNKGQLHVKGTEEREERRRWGGYLALSKEITEKIFLTKILGFL